MFVDDGGRGTRDRRRKAFRGDGVQCLDQLTHLMTDSEPEVGRDRIHTSCSFPRARNEEAAITAVTPTTAEIVTSRVRHRRRRVSVSVTISAMLTSTGNSATVVRSST